jgi:hypothetical protein
VKGEHFKNPLIFWLLTYWKLLQKSDDFSKEIMSKTGKLGPFFSQKTFVCVIFLRLKKICKKKFTKILKNGANMFNIPVKINANIMA